MENRLRINTPQVIYCVQGVISPVLANLALDGLERVAKGVAPPRSRAGGSPKVNVVRYADDFIITGSSYELLQEKIKPAVAAFLGERGLRLSEAKTQITQIEAGFDFLGANVRKYNGKLLIKPSKSNLQSFLRGIRQFIRDHKTTKTTEMIRRLNRRIRGWANSHRHLVASRAFRYLDTCVFRALWQWVRRRHPRKGVSWLWRRYYRSQGSRNWIFSARMKAKDGTLRYLDLFQASSMPIRRHVKVQAKATAFDPEFDDYFRQRWLRKRHSQKGDAMPEYVVYLSHHNQKPGRAIGS